MVITPHDLPPALRRRFPPGVAIAQAELASLLDDADPHVRALTATALGRLRPADPATVRALAAAVLRSADHADDASHDGELERARANPDDEPREAFAAMDDFAARIAASDALAGLGPDGAAAANELARGLGAARISVRVAAARALASGGRRSPQARDALIAGLGEGTGWFVRAAAARALGDWGPDAADALPHLRTASTMGSDEVDTVVALALWRIAGDANDAVRRLVRVLEVAPYHERTGALAAIAAIGPPAAAAVPTLVAGLTGYGAPFRYDVVRALAAIGPAAAPATSGLADALGDPSPLVREAAAVALGAIGPAAAEALDALRAARDDETDPDPNADGMGFRFSIAGREYARHGTLLLAADGRRGAVARARAAAALAITHIRTEHR